MQKDSLIFGAANILALASFIILTALVISGCLDRFNTVVYQAVASLINPTLTGFIILISAMGQWSAYLPLAIILLLAKTRYHFGLPLASILLITSPLNLILKAIFAQPRPEIHQLVSAGGYGYPSGHSMVSAAFLGLGLFLILKILPSKPLKIALALVLPLYILLVGFSRIYLGVHFATDVIGGYIAGLWIVLIFIRIIDSVEKHKGGVAPEN